jgi:hypothetical protein
MSPEDEASLLSGETTYKDGRQNAARICPNLFQSVPNIAEMANLTA